MRPCSPTAQFAHPELATIALTLPLEVISLVHVTDGETTEF